MISFIRQKRGQSVVELALVLPFLLLVLFGITEFGRAWATQNVLTSAAREGARLAVVTGPDVGLVTSRVTTVCAAAGITPTDITVVPPDPFDPERRVTVTVNCNFQILTGTLLGGFSGTVPLSASTTMRHESM
jgi:Flp pilus assembly protein TadG